MGDGPLLGGSRGHGPLLGGSRGLGPLLGGPRDLGLPLGGSLAGDPSPFIYLAHLICCALLMHTSSSYPFITRSVSACG